MNIEWETPQDFFDALNREFSFTLDVCAIPYNAKCQKFFTPEKDGLSQDWTNDIVFMNPPYDKTMPKWIQKAYETAQKGGYVVALITSRGTDTKMWHDWVMKASEIRFIKDRLHFSLNGTSRRANLPSAVVIFKPLCSGPPKISSINIKGERI